MSTVTPWSVKGIDAKAREVAKDLARRSGMTLGEWLNQTIMEGGFEPESGSAPDVAPVRSTSSQNRSSGQGQSPRHGQQRQTQGQTQGHRGNLNRGQNAHDDYVTPYAAHEARRRDAALAVSRDFGRHGASGHDYSRGYSEEYQQEAPSSYDFEPSFERAPPAAEMSRVARVLDSLGARLESSETRSASAVRGVSHAVESLLTRLEKSEARVAEQEKRLHGQASEFETSVDLLARTQEEAQSLGERLGLAERVVDVQAQRLDGLTSHVREERERLARLEAEVREPKDEGLKVVEGSLGKLANQLYEDETRTRASLADVRQDMLGLSHRLAQIELQDPQGDAQNLIDQVVAKLAHRLELAESKTSGAIKSLEQAFAILDRRLTGAEARGDVTDPEAVQSLTRLANDLSSRVEGARAEMVRAFEEASRKHHNDGRLSGIERGVQALAGQVGAIERRSAKALEQMGQDVLRVADTLGRRVDAVEQATIQSKNETLMLSQSVKASLAQSEGANDSAIGLQRLGVEIARISERLNGKIAETEQRTKAALDGINSQISQQNERVDTDLTQRIAKSEARTQALLEDARRKIESRLVQVQTSTLLKEQGAGALRADLVASKPLAEDLPNPFAIAQKNLAQLASEPRLSAALPKENGVTSEQLDAVIAPKLYNAHIEKSAEKSIEVTPFSNFANGFNEDGDTKTTAVSQQVSIGSGADSELDMPQLKSHRYGSNDDLDLTGRLLGGIADIANREIQTHTDGDDMEIEFDVEPNLDAPIDDEVVLDDNDEAFIASLKSEAPLSVFDDEDDSDPFAEIDQSRKTSPKYATADTQIETKTSQTSEFSEKEFGSIDDIFDTASSGSRADFAQEDLSESAQTNARLSTRDALLSARAAVLASSEGVVAIKKAAPDLKSGASRTNATDTQKPKAHSGIMGQIFKASAVSAGTAVILLAGVAAVNYFPQITHAPTQKEQTGQAADQDFIAAAVTELPSPARAQDDLDQLKAIYQEAQQAKTANDPKALELLKNVASLGYPEAQNQLGIVYEGQSDSYKDAKIDKIEARKWYERAANSGHIEAMHNLAMMYYNGQGGEKNNTIAATWFQKAAQLGFVNSQFNLASLYEQGAGVPKSPVDAYKWYMIAAMGGDQEAPERASFWRSQISDEQRSDAESQARSFKNTLSKAPLLSSR